MESNKTQNKSQKSFKAFLLDSKYILLFYVLGDWLTTFYALQYGNEGNAIPAMILNKFGIFALLFVKLFFVAVLYFCYLSFTNHQRNWDILKFAVIAVGVFAVVNNLLVVICGTSLIQMMGIIN